MSSGLDGVSDNDDHDDSDADDNPHMFTAPDDDVDKSDSGQRSKEGLNPWSIAKLVSSHRKPSPQPERAAQETHHETPLQPPGHGATNGGDGASSLITREPPPGRGVEAQRGALESQPSRRNALENPASRGRSIQEVFGQAPRKAPPSHAREADRHGRSRHNRGLQSPPTSSHEYAYGGRGTKEHRLPRHAARSVHLTQSRLSFDRNDRRQRRRDRANLDHDQELAGFTRPTRRTGASASARRLDIEDVDLMMADDFAVNLNAQETNPQALPSRQLLSCVAAGGGETSTETGLQRGLDEDTAQSSLLTDDPRTRLIKQQRLMTQNSQNKPRRLKTEQLPLETIPRGSQTCTLLLTVVASGCNLTKLFLNASRFDTWLVDGEVKSAFKEGTGPEDVALLVETLLARIYHGETGLSGTFLANRRG